MDRATDAQKAERLNHARELLRRFDHLPNAVAQLVKDSGVSPRQAYRYMQQARRLKQSVRVGDAKIAFTVKLSQALAFDRLLPQKLEQAYELLVPQIRRPISSVDLNSAQEVPHESARSDLHTRVIGSSERESYDCQSNRGLDGVCKKQRIRGAGGMDVSRRRI